MKSMTTTTIYRIQDRAGRGPFKPGFTRYWLGDRTEAEMDFLTVFDNAEVWRAMQGVSPKFRFMGYGCRDLDQLRRWFLPNEYRYLFAAGYRAVEMSADAVLLESGSQVLFARAIAFRRQVATVQLYPRL